jgi:predicted RNA-binding Zn-ribbon protein involved in translation (DUF1610 family)
MSKNADTDTGEKTDAAENTSCHKCKGAGVISIVDIHRPQADFYACDQCGAGQLVWSRFLEILASVDMPVRS